MKNRIFFYAVNIFIMMSSFLCSCDKHKVIYPMVSESLDDSQTKKMYICSYNVGFEPVKNYYLEKSKEGFAENYYKYYSTKSDSLVKIKSWAHVSFILNCKDASKCYVTGFHKKHNVFYIDCDTSNLPEKIEAYIIKTNSEYGSPEYQGNACDDSTLWNIADTVIAKVILKKVE